VVAGTAALATVLAGCAGSGGGKAAASSSVPKSSASPSQGADLAPGLLPADAFGSGAAVTSITVQQLQQGTGLAGGSLQGAQISPEACAALVKSTRPQGDQLRGAAAEVAREGTSGTVELLAVSDHAKELVSGVGAAIAACPQAQVTLPQGGSATITFQKLDVPKLGDGSAGVSFTTVGTAPGGRQVTVPALLGFAVDGDRVVTLITAAPQGPAPDQAAFTALLQKAFQVQKDKLD
jgi:hypothetical protein